MQLLRVVDVVTNDIALSISISADVVIVNILRPTLSPVFLFEQSFETLSCT